MTDKPFFRFFPKAYEIDGVFKHSTEICESCQQPATWLYVGVIYTQRDPKICARCISSGALDAFFGEGLYGFQDSRFVNVDRDLSDEVLRRTPGVASFNPVDWPVLNSKPLAFFGYGDSEDVWKNPGAITAMNKKWLAYAGESLEGRTPYLLVFKEIDGPEFVSVLDLD